MYWSNGRVSVIGSVVYEFEGVSLGFVFQSLDDWGYSVAFGVLVVTFYVVR